MIALNMPRLSDSMEEGTIVRWTVPDGAPVSVGDELAEIETDKAVLPLEAVADGRLHIGAEEGTTLPVGTPIGWLLEENESPPESADNPESVSEVTKGVTKSDIAGAARSDLGGGPDASRQNVSPIARRTADELGIDLKHVTGTGPRGRITKADVLRAYEAPGTLSPPSPSGAPVPDKGRGVTHTIPLTGLQKTVARRMAESKGTAPEFTLTIDVDMELAVELRSHLRELLDPTPSINDLVIKALALALKQHPNLNASYGDEGIEQFSRINIGVAVAETGALLVPTIFDADTATLTTIAAETRRLAERARSGRLTPEEMTGSTATVSNLGMFGIKQFTGILNPPEAMILAVGAVERRPVATDEGITARQRMTVTGTFDHRVVYGAEGAQLLATFRELLEQPLRFLL